MMGRARHTPEPKVDAGRPHRRLGNSFRGTAALSNPGNRAAPAQGLWYVLHTKSRQEKILANELAARSVEHYLPLIKRPRFYGNRKATVEEPLFPGYVFLLGDVDQAYLADRTKRVANIIHVPDQRKFQWELDNIRLALSHDAPLDPYPDLIRGVRVEVRSGPFQGLQGVIEDKGKDARLILQVDVLGRAVSLEIHGALLEPLP
jgi:transcriptional antiterminator NusG